MPASHSHNDGDLLRPHAARRRLGRSRAASRISAPLLVLVFACGCSTSFRQHDLSMRDGGVLNEIGGGRSSSARSCLERGRKLAAEQRDDEAILQLQRAQELAPGLEGVAHALAVLYDRQGEWTAASREYRRALEESPQNAALMNDYGYFLYCQGDYTQSEASFRQALAEQPGHQKARLNLGLVLGAQGRTDEALTEFKAAVGTAAAHHNVGVILARHGRQEEATAHLRKAMRLDPDLRQASLILAQLEEDLSPNDGDIRQASWEVPQSP